MAMGVDASLFVGVGAFSAQAVKPMATASTQAALKVCFFIVVLRGWGFDLIRLGTVTIRDWNAAKNRV
jgi:hypothetical protein